MKPAQADPKGLMRESFRMAGIGAQECRSIFVDWVLSLPEGTDVRQALRTVIAEHAQAAPADHPMTAVLTEGLTGTAPAARRGGRAGRTAPARREP